VLHFKLETARARHVFKPPKSTKPGAYESQNVERRAERGELDKCTGLDERSVLHGRRAQRGGLDDAVLIRRLYIKPGSDLE
jgi:hypothetical protein